MRRDGGALADEGDVTALVLPQVKIGKTGDRSSSFGCGHGDFREVSESTFSEFFQQQIYVHTFKCSPRTTSSLGGSCDFFYSEFGWVPTALH